MKFIKIILVCFLLVSTANARSAFDIRWGTDLNSNMRSNTLKQWAESIEGRVGGNQGAGSAWYVDSNVTTEGDGTSWTDARDTLDEAINLASAGDWIYVSEGHAESGSAANLWDADVAGITIKHYGNGARMGTYTFADTDTTVSVGAANVTIIGGRLLAGISEVVIGLDVTADADYLTVIGMEFPEPTTSGFEFNIAVQLVTGADDVAFIGCIAYSADATGADHWFNGGAGVVNRLILIDNTVYGEFAIASIFSDQIDLECSIISNTVTNLTSGEHAIEFTAAATGDIADNRVYTDGYWTAIDPGSMKSTKPNWVANAINESPQMFPRAETDRAFLEILMGREIGAVAGSAEEIKVWWVDGGAGSTGDGKSPEGAFDTIEEALTECSDTADDWILVQDYSGSTNEITIANSFVHLIGYGSPGMFYPRIQASTSGEAGFILGDAADYVEIAYFIIASTGSAAGIEFNGSGGSYAVWIHDCIFGRSGNTVQDGIEIMAGGAAPHLLVENCRFGQGAASSVTRDGIRFSGNASWSIVRNNVFRSVDGIGIDYRASMTQPMAHDNHFQLAADGVGDAIDVASGASGGYFFNNTAAFGEGEIIADVFRDQGTGNEWSNNSGGELEAGKLYSLSKAAVMTGSTDDLFLIAGGPIEIVSMFGECTTSMGSSPGTCKINLNSATDTYDKDFTTAVNIDAFAIGDAIRFTNAIDTGVLDLTADVGAGQTLSWFCNAGTIEQTLGSTGTGGITWYITFRPLAGGVTVAVQ